MTRRNGSGPLCSCSIPTVQTVFRLLHNTSSICLQRVPSFSSKMEEKLIELVGKSEELRDMSNKKYSDSVAKEKSLGTRR